MIPQEGDPIWIRGQEYSFVRFTAGEQYVVFDTGGAGIWRYQHALVEDVVWREIE